MARYLVTINFTRNGVSLVAVTAVPVSMAASATIAMNNAVASATGWLKHNETDVVVIGTTSVLAQASV